MLLSVMMTSIVFVLFGIALASGVKTVTEYLMFSVVITLPAALPLLDFFGIIKSDFFFLLPTQGTLKLLERMYASVSVREIVLSVFSLAVWALFFWFAASRRFGKKVVSGE